MQSAIPVCPITQEPFCNPVIDPEGNTYEKSAIVQWLNENNVSPITRTELYIFQLVPNRALIDIIAATKNKPTSSSARQSNDWSEWAAAQRNAPASFAGNIRPCSKCNKMIQVSDKYKGKKNPMCFACRPKACWKCTFLNDSNMTNCEMCNAVLN